jgi:hypothetical protein
VIEAVELCVDEGELVATCVGVFVDDTVFKAVLPMVLEGVVERDCVEVCVEDGVCVLPCVDVIEGLEDCEGLNVPE